MHIEQALKMAIALIQAVDQALAAGDSVVTLTSLLQAADDAARDELADAIEAANRRIGDND